MSNNVANLRLDIEVPSPWEEFVASLPTPIASAEARPGSLPEQPQQDARVVAPETTVSAALMASNEDADSDADTTSMESTEAEDSRTEESEEEPDSEWERDAAAAPAPTAPRSRKKRSLRNCGSAKTFSKYVGVSHYGEEFAVRINVDGKEENLGKFSSEVEAAKAYDARARQLGRKLNFPTDNDPLKYTGVYTVGKSDKFRASIRESGEHNHIGTFTSAVEAAKAFDARARQIGRVKHLNFPTAEELRSNKTRSRPSAPSSASEQPSKRVKRAAETAGSTP